MLCNKKSFVFVHQHGAYDVTCKPPIRGDLTIFFQRPAGRIGALGIDWYISGENGVSDVT